MQTHQVFDIEDPNNGTNWKIVQVVQNKWILDVSKVEDVENEQWSYSVGKVSCVSCCWWLHKRWWWTITTLKRIKRRLIIMTNHVSTYSISYLFSFEILICLIKFGFYVPKYYVIIPQRFPKGIWSISKVQQCVQ